MNGSEKKEIEGYARIVLDNMFHFAGLLDLEGRIKYINKPALNSVGMDLKSLVGIHFWKSNWFQTSKKNVELQKSFIQSALNGNFIREDIEVFGKNNGKGKITTDYSLKPIYNKKNKLLFLLAEGRDITDKKHLEVELEQKNRSLKSLIEKNQKLSNQQSEFFSNISHEFKTPLSLIIGNIDLYISEKFQKNIPSELSSIRQNSISILSLVEELLELSKIDNGRINTDFTDTNISTIIQQVITGFYSLTRHRKINITTNFKDDIIANVDKNKLKTILTNLLSNSFKMIPNGGSIHFETAIIKHHKFTIKISDNGPGVPDSYKDKIFDRFQTGENNFQTYHSNTGLGLAIVKEYCLIHGGDINIYDREPFGATFTITLPFRTIDRSHTNKKKCLLLTDPNITHELQPISTKGSVNPYQVNSDYILIVEDNIEIADLIARSISKHYNIFICYNGQEAWNTINQEKPLLVITDLMMPVSNGLSLIKRIKTDKNLSNIPIIVLSAKKDDETRMNLLSEYVDDYITKPFFIPELLSRVRNTAELYISKAIIQKELSSHNKDLSVLVRQMIDAKHELQKANDAQKDIQYRMNAIYKSSSVGIVVIDETYKFIDINPFLCNLLEYSQDELRNKKIIDVTYEKDINTTLRRLKKLVNNKKNYNYEKRFVSKSGKVIWTTASVFSIPSNESQASLLIGIIQDISDKVKMRQSLEESRRDIEHFSRVSTVSEFASSIVHELNQPLSAIIVNSTACENWLAKSNIDNSEVTHSLDLIKTDAIRSSEIIVSIRNYIKKSKPKYDSCTISLILEDIKNIITPELRFHGISFYLPEPSYNSLIYIDTTSIKQVFLNLILNAIQALQSYESDSKKISIKTQYRNKKIFISVIDNGPGVEPEKLKTLFHPFSSTKRDGLGLGLSICKGMLEEYGTTLSYSHNKPNGSNFTFHLPTE
jgi:PAS domain S-box-containing protein